MTYFADDYKPVSTAAKRADQLRKERFERANMVRERLPLLLAAMVCRADWSHVEHEFINYACLALDEFDNSLQEGAAPIVTVSDDLTCDKG